VDAKRSCQRCGSWNLLPLGIGIERVEEEVRAAFGTAPVTVIAPDTAQSPSKMKKVLAAAYERNDIIAATEAALPWLYAVPPTRPTFGVIASADSLLALPFWRARERFVRLSLFFSGIVDTLLMLTRHPEDAAVEALTASGGSFWNEETALRKALAYPPFGTLITATAEGSSSAVVELIDQISFLTSAYGPVVLPPRQLGARVSQTIVLALKQQEWPDTKLSLLLSSLPPAVRVRIDPESLW
jgi:primosomal protein N' (replication factor Y)